MGRGHHVLLDRPIRTTDPVSLLGRFVSNPSDPLQNFRPRPLALDLGLSEYHNLPSKIEDYEAFISDISTTATQAGVRGAIQGSLGSASTQSMRLEAPTVWIYSLNNVRDAFKAVVEKEVVLIDSETGYQSRRTLFETQIRDLRFNEKVWWIVGVKTVTDGRYELARGAQRNTAIAAQVPVGTAVSTNLGVPNTDGVGDIDAVRTTDRETQLGSMGTYTEEHIFGVAYCEALFQRRSSRHAGREERVSRTVGNPLGLGKKRPQIGDPNPSFRGKNVTTFSPDEGRTDEDEDEDEDEDDDFDISLDLEEGDDNSVLNDFLCARFDEPIVQM